MSGSGDGLGTRLLPGPQRPQQAGLHVVGHDASGADVVERLIEMNADL